MSNTNIMVSFAIIGDMQPDEVTAKLKITPTKVINKNEVRRGGMLAKTSIWEYRIDYTETLELSEQFRILLLDSGLLNKIETLIYIKENEDVFMRLSASINIHNNDSPVIWIEPIIASFTSKLDINIDITTYLE